jgi:hypothetical protein
MGRFALGKAVDYMKTRQVWKTADRHPSGRGASAGAAIHIEVEMAKLMMQKAATLYDSRRRLGRRRGRQHGQVRRR